MTRGRWYPTAMVMGNGDVVITAGTDQDSTDVTIPEVWRYGSIRQLTGASQRFPWYSRAFIAPVGSLFVAGQQALTRFLSLAAERSWRNGPRRVFEKDHSYGSAVMYEDGKILFLGGGVTTSTAEVIDQRIGADQALHGIHGLARRHLNLTVLPTGEVLATGRVGGNTFDDVSKGGRAGRSSW